MASQRVITMTAGVYFREFDISQYIVSLSTTRLALVGVASQGVTDQDILITSLQQGIQALGVPSADKPALLVMREYFQAGGGELHFTRVANGDIGASASIPLVTTGNSTINAKTTGSFFNDISLQVSYSNQLKQQNSADYTFPALTRTTPITVGGTKKTGDVLTVTITDAALTGGFSTASYTVGSGDADLTAVAAGLAAAISTATGYALIGLTATATGAVVSVVDNSANATAYSQAVTGSSPTTTVNIGSTTNVLTATYSVTLPNAPLVPNTVQVKFGGTLAGNDVGGTGTITFLSGNTGFSGTVDYTTGIVTITTNNLIAAVPVSPVLITANYWGAFNLQVRYTVRDANNSVVNKYVLESFTGLTPDTFLDGIANSNFLTCDAAPTAFFTAGNFPMTGGDDGKDNINDADFVGNVLGETPTGMQVYAFPDDIDINVLAVPGVSSAAVRQAMQQLCEVSRSDTLFLLDPPTGLTPQQVVDWANGDGDFSSYNTMDSTYGAIFYPEITTFNSITNINEITPPSACAVQGLVRSNAWQAPAGPNRGTIQNIITTGRKLNPNDRAYLDANRINSISKLNGLSEMLLGQRTCTLEASSLDRIAARRMLMTIEKSVTTSLFSLLFEPNTDVTWNRAINIVQPYLDNLVAKEQIYYGQFYCDGITNSIQTINNNQMIAICELQLLKYAEIIVVNFLVSALGANITEQAASIITQ